MSFELSSTYAGGLSSYADTATAIIRCKTKLNKNWPQYTESRRRRWYFRIRAKFAETELNFWWNKYNQWGNKVGVINFTDKNEEKWTFNTKQEAQEYARERLGYFLDERKFFNDMCIRESEELKEYSLIDFEERNKLTALEAKAQSFGWPYKSTKRPTLDPGHFVPPESEPARPQPPATDDLDRISLRDSPVASRAGIFGDVDFLKHY